MNYYNDYYKSNSKTKVFISFDFDHDEDLKNLFVGQAKHEDTPFEITDMSVKEELSGNWKEKAIKEKVRYTLEDHLGGISPKAKKIFEAINEKIVALDESIIVEPKAKYIAYKLATNFVDIVVKQYGLKIFLNVPSGELNDPHGIARDLTKPKKIGHWGNGDYEVKLEKEEEIDQVFELIKQSYTYNK